MNRISVPGWRPFGCRLSARAAFTLIELLAVMAIILLLAGLVLGIAGNAQYKAALSRAEGEIKQMETAMESYKVDNGTYPRNTDTDALNAQAAVPPDPSTYLAASKYLFTQLSGNTQLASTNPTTSFTKAYITFVPGQLSTGSADPSAATYIIDPFGLSYGFSTAAQKAAETAAASTATPAPTPDPTMGYNPTFDLWSTGGYANGGKTYPSDVPAAQQSTLWKKNW